jgi:hypothetical protein
MPTRRSLRSALLLLYCCFPAALLVLFAQVLDTYPQVLALSVELRLQVLLHYCCFTAALLLLYCCFTAALLLLYCNFADAGDAAVSSGAAAPQ